MIHFYNYFAFFFKQSKQKTQKKRQRKYPSKYLKLKIMESLFDWKIKNVK